MIRSFTRRLAALVLLAAAAHGAAAGDLVIDQPWARATIGQAPNGSAYLTISNRGAVDDRLLAMRTPAAARTELHTHAMHDGMLRMQAVPGVAIAAGATVRFAPGGLHVMFFDLREPLRAGQRLPLILQFEKAGEVAIVAQVLEAGSMGPPGMPQGH